MSPIRVHECWTLDRSGNTEEFIEFQYLRDPVFLAAAALYVLNRGVLKPLTAGHPGALEDFLNGQVNDLLCIPFCLPPFLCLERWIGVRRHDGPPTRMEIFGCLILWSALFEWIAPRLPLFFPSAVGDPRDVAAYACGAIIAGLIWGGLRPPSLRSPPLCAAGEGTPPLEGGRRR